MRRDSVRLWLTAVMVGAGLGIAESPRCAAKSPFTSTRNRLTFPAAKKPGMGESVTSSVKEGLGKFVNAVKLKPRVKPAADPISLASKANPGVELHVAVARLYQESGRLTEAEEHFQKALREAPNDAGALLGYAHLKDRLGEPAEARRLYVQAATAHPKQAAIHNNLGLFLAQRGMLTDAASAFARAVQLQPKNPRYRNNFASLLVKMGRTNEALAHLRVAHSQAVAHYNLGYLLEKQGKPQAAAQQFAFALRADPSLVSARQSLQRLQSPSARPGPPADRPSADTRVGSRPARSTPQPKPRPLLQNPFAAARRPTPRQPGPIRPPWLPGQGSKTRASGAQPDKVAPLPSDRARLLRLPPTAPAPPGATQSAPLPPSLDRRRPPTAAPLPPQIGKGPALPNLPRTN